MFLFKLLKSLQFFTIHMSKYNIIAIFLSLCPPKQPYLYPMPLHNTHAFKQRHLLGLKFHISLNDFFRISKTFGFRLSKANQIIFTSIALTQHPSHSLFFFPKFLKRTYQLTQYYVAHTARSY